MHVVQVQTPHPQDFEEFPEGCARSCVGALRLMPGAALEITAGELAAMQAVGIQLRVLRAPAEPPQALPLPVALDELPASPVNVTPPQLRREKKGKATA